MRYFSMFSGVGGIELGIDRAADGKWECVGFSEIDKYAVQTYLKHFPTHKNYGDATKINPSELPEFDMLCGGFPCQTFSIAGKRMGFEDTRGTLFFDIARIAKERRPRIIFLENVKGLLNHDKGRTFAVILATLDELGYNAEWQVLNSKYFGVPQNRERVFIIGHLRGTRSRQIFPIRQGDGSYGAEQRSDTGKEGDGMHLSPKLLQARESGQLHSGEINMAQKSGKEIARVYNPEGLSPTLKGKTGGWQEPKIMALRGRDNETDKRFQNMEINEEGVCNTLSGVQKDNLVVTPRFDGREGRSCLKSERVPEAAINNKIRRLTEIECERLQSFPDRYSEGVSGTQRYRQMGNAVTVNVIEEIVKRLLHGEEI